jgi:hypothetical protein
MDQGTYAKLVPNGDTKEKIAEILDLLNLHNPACIRDLHVTVVYSKVECPEIHYVIPQMPITATGTKFDLFSNADGSKCLVLRLESEAILALHDHCRNLGASHEYPYYNPHITLSYDYFDALPNDSILDFFGDLVFTEFAVEPLGVEYGTLYGDIA